MPEDSSAPRQKTRDTDQRRSDYFFRARRMRTGWLYVSIPPFETGEQRDTASEDSRGLSQGARLVLEFLRQRGASFFADIVRATGKLKAEIETALWELVAGRPGHGRWIRQFAVADRSETARWAGKRTDDTAAAQCGTVGIAARGRRGGASTGGRGGLLDALAEVWNRLPRSAGKGIESAQWRELLMGFRRLEDRGEIRGGRFVDGFLGEQFALPIAVESVRGMRNCR